MKLHSPIKPYLVVLLSFMLAAMPLASARVQPTSGFDLFSDQEEIQAGQQAAAQTERQFPLLPESSPVTKYIQKLGHELADHAPGYKWPYSFHVIDQREINAFALPGGPIFVNLGTIQAADNEAELAGVLAHEISHVVQRHGTRAASKQMAAQLPLAIMAGLMGRSTLAQMAQLGISFGVGSYFLHNSRESESEADLLGTDIMYDTGFDPHAMAEFFNKLEEQSGKQGAVAQFLSDHPDPGNRAQAVDREVATLPPKQYRGNSPEFLRVKEIVAKMHPMTAGQIAAWQKEHPAGAEGEQSAPAVPGEMQQLSRKEYNISYPQGWRVFTDGDSSVTVAPESAVSQNGISQGAVISQFEAANTANLDQATQAIIASLQKSNPGLKQVGTPQEIRVNGLPGRSVDLLGPSGLESTTAAGDRSEASASSNSGNQNAAASNERDWLVTMQRGDGAVFYVVFVGPRSSFDSLRPTYQQMLKTLKLK